MPEFDKRPFVGDDRQESPASTLTDANWITRGKIASERESEGGIGRVIEMTANSFQMFD